MLDQGVYTVHDRSDAEDLAPQHHLIGYFNSLLDFKLFNVKKSKNLKMAELAIRFGNM